MYQNGGENENNRIQSTYDLFKAGYSSDGKGLHTDHTYETASGYAGCIFALFRSGSVWYCNRRVTCIPVSGGHQ